MKFLRLLLVLVFSGSLLAQSPKTDSLKQELAKPHHDTVRFHILRKLMRRTQAEDVKEAIMWSEKLMQSGEKLGGLYLGDACYFTGQFLGKLGHEDSAIVVLRKAVEVYSRFNEQRGLAQTYNLMAGAYLDKSDLKNALDYYIRSLAIKEKLGDKNMIANACSNIGNVYDQMANSEKALSYYNKAGNLKKELGDTVGYATCLSNASMVYMRLNRHDEALRVLNLARSYCDSATDSEVFTAILGNIGDTYGAMKDYRQAENYLLRCIHARTLVTDSTDLCYSYVSLANIYFADKKYKEAIRYGEKCKTIAQRYGWMNRVYDACNLLAQVHYETGNYKASADNMFLLAQVNDSIYNAQNTKSINELEVKYESEKKDAALKLDHEKLLNQQLEIDRQNTLKLCFAVGFLLATGVIVFVYRSSRQKQKANEIISQQKMEVEQQKLLLQVKNSEITDSILYARRIQSSLITSEKYISKTLGRLNPDKKNKG